MKSPVMKLRSVGVVVRFALLCGAGAALPGCILGEDSDPPILSVDFYWDADRRNSADTCASAGVASMDWQLADPDGNVVDEQDGECSDGFNFLGVDPGRYTLKVNGYDDDHNKLWEGSCPLLLDRFDRAYRCDVGRVTPGTPE